MMASAPLLRCCQVTVVLAITLSGFFVLFLMYHKSNPSATYETGPADSWSSAPQVNFPKPVLLLWFWPGGKTFDLQDCGRILDLDACSLTDDRELFSTATGVLLFHKAIQADPSNLPTSPRPKFQSWIWFNMDTPSNTDRIEGIQNLFNLTLSYRADADIQVRWRLIAKKDKVKDFVLPRKERLLCWIVNINDLLAKTEERFYYFLKLVKHIRVNIFDSSEVDFSQGRDYFRTISSCKFFLSFEDSTERDFITERFNGPLAAGTVPVVLGPPRSNYEDFAPGSSFIHVNDFPDASTLAQHIQNLDKNLTAYMRYFDWRQFYSARRHPTEEKHEFLLAVCEACHYLGTNSDYRTVPDLYSWLSQ